MSEEEILSEEEMSDLTKSHDSEGGSSKEELYDHGQILSYDFKQPQHTKQSHFPTLHIINEKTVIDLRDRLELMLQQKVDVRAQHSYINKFGEFVHSLKIPIAIKKINVPELKGSLYVCFDDNFICSVIEEYFGAPSTTKEKLSNDSDDEDESDAKKENKPDYSPQIEEIVEKEEFTNAESRISQKLLNYVLESMSSGWSLLDHYNFIYEKTESNPKLINDLDHDELVVNMHFEVKIRDTISAIRIAIPYKTLDKVKHKLRRVVQDIQEVGDQKWLKKLYEKMQSVNMELVAELGSIVMPVGKLVELKVGDDLRIQKPDKITISVNGTPIMTGQLGDANGQTAIQIDQWIKPENQ